MLDSFILPFLFMCDDGGGGGGGGGRWRMQSTPLFHTIDVIACASHKHFPANSYFIFIYFLRRFGIKFKRHWFTGFMFVCCAVFVWCATQNLTICIDMCYNPCLKFLTLVTFIPAVSSSSYDPLYKSFFLFLSAMAFSKQIYWNDFNETSNKNTFSQLYSQIPFANAFASIQAHSINF